MQWSTISQSALPHGVFFQLIELQGVLGGILKTLGVKVQIMTNDRQLITDDTQSQSQSQQKSHITDQPPYLSKYSLNKYKLHISIHQLLKPFAADEYGANTYVHMAYKVFQMEPKLSFGLRRECPVEFPGFGHGQDFFGDTTESHVMGVSSFTSHQWHLSTGHHT